MESIGCGECVQFGSQRMKGRKNTLCIKEQLNVPLRKSNCENLIYETFFFQQDERIIEKLVSFSRFFKFGRPAQLSHWLVALESPVIFAALSLGEDCPICFSKIEKNWS